MHRLLPLVLWLSCFFPTLVHAQGLGAVRLPAADVATALCQGNAQISPDALRCDTRRPLTADDVPCEHPLVVPLNDGTALAWEGSFVARRGRMLVLPYSGCVAPYQELEAPTGLFPNYGVAFLARQGAALSLVEWDLSYDLVDCHVADEGGGDILLCRHEVTALPRPGDAIARAQPLQETWIRAYTFRPRGGGIFIDDFILAYGSSRAPFETVEEVACEGWYYPDDYFIFTIGALAATDGGRRFTAPVSFYRESDQQRLCAQPSAGAIAPLYADQAPPHTIKPAAARRGTLEIIPRRKSVEVIP